MQLSVATKNVSALDLALMAVEKMITNKRLMTIMIMMMKRKMEFATSAKNFTFEKTVKNLVL